MPGFTCERGIQKAFGVGDEMFFEEEVYYVVVELSLCCHGWIRLILLNSAVIHDGQRYEREETANVEAEFEGQQIWKLSFVRRPKLDRWSAQSMVLVPRTKRICLQTIKYLSPIMSFGVSTNLNTSVILPSFNANFHNHHCAFITLKLVTLVQRHLRSSRNRIGSLDHLPMYRR